MVADDAVTVPVNEAEYAKFCYLIKVVDSIDRAHDLALRHLKHFKEQEGVRGYMNFDWRQLISFVQPQLLLIFLRDGERDPVQQVFMEYPFAAVVARTAQVVELDSVFELSLEGSDLHPEVDEVTNAFRILEAKTRSLSGQRSQDANRVLNQLRRVLRLEL